MEAAWTPTQPAAANVGNGTWAQQENAEALCRTRTVDPLLRREGTSRNGWQATANALLTMRSKRQPVAIDRNGFGLFCRSSANSIRR